MDSASNGWIVFIRVRKVHNILNNKPKKLIDDYSSIKFALQFNTTSLHMTYKYVRCGHAILNANL